MKTLFAMILATALLAICGCNPDHSGDTRAPVPIAKSTTPTVVDANPNVPAAVKQKLKGITGAAAATPGR